MSNIRKRERESNRLAFNIYTYTVFVLSYFPKTANTIYGIHSSNTWFKSLTKDLSIIDY